MPDAQRSNRLAFLHGFTQTHHHWHASARAIATASGSGPSLVFVDLPGHGLSGDDRSDIDEVAATLPHLVGPATWIGYSMGGRHALVAAAGGAPEIERLVVIGATPGIEDAAERDARTEVDRQRADHVEAIGVEAFIDEWLAAPMFAGLPADVHDVVRRRRNTAAGLGHSLRSAGTGAQPSVWGWLANIEVPVLVIAGARDGKFTEIGQRMVERLPAGEFATVAAAGHAAHAEQPAAVADIIGTWLAAT